ncbi:copper uptake system-associated protein [Paenochrobactrum pullorum]|uniref:copper uptake system-associated protein n=1 Tax=Paenochrobactrum pullorum TaxID=1324351 RepID=UPI0035BBBABA
MSVNQYLQPLFIGLVMTIGIYGNPASAAENDNSPAAIRHVLMEMFDQPEQRLTVAPVVIKGDIALAGWAQGETGGRALLRQQKGQWHIVLCGGDSIREAKALQQFGLTVDQAEEMAKSIVNAEAKLDPALVQKFSLFDGVMVMNDDGSHPPVH